MKKHAYLIMAHNQFEMLKKIIHALDYERHDIYVHIDKKSTDFCVDEFTDCVSYSDLYFTKKRINVKWGDYSQIEAELLLMKECCKKEYSYVHLISGADLPLKSPDEIYCFFEESGQNFLDVSGSDNWSTEMTQWYSFFKENNYSNIYLINFGRRILQIQQHLGFQRKTYKAECILKGSQWFSLTQDTIRYILKNKNRIRKTFLFTYAPDELFIPTILYGSKYYEMIKKEDGNKRYIVWDGESKSPKTLTMDDYAFVMGSNELFARKFSVDIDSEIVNRILENGDMR